jgi:CRISPR/Cas system CMR subunit Cmr6 (Cas7 group RAMP superfamily)
VNDLDDFNAFAGFFEALWDFINIIPKRKKPSRATAITRHIIRGLTEEAEDDIDRNKKLEGAIILKSGLHIGSGNMEMHIGGTDSPVIKHPHTLEPYIPGSSLKGKIRSLLEMASGLVPVASHYEKRMAA